MSGKWGNTIGLTSNEFPILKHLSIQRLVLKISGIREPHWHANANKLIYCLCGSALITMFGNHDQYDTFMINEGQVCFIPYGCVHYIENLNKISTSEFIIALSHELPEEFNLLTAFSDMTDAVLQLPRNVWKDVIKRRNEIKFEKMEKITNIDNDEMYINPNKYKFDIEKMSPPPFMIPEESIKMASKIYWPILENISMFSLRISTTGMCEPHWHPETAEMGYIVAGDARITILLPNADHRLYTSKLKADDVYFIPRAYPYNIENIGNGELKILIFFDQAIKTQQKLKIE